MIARAIRFGQRYAVIIVALAGAFLIKYHYSRASVDDLRWVLAPTAWLSAHLLGTELSFRVGEGYLSREHSILISSACAGVNFLVVALSALGLGCAPRDGGLRSAVRFLLVIPPLAYAATLATNALRIALSVRLAPPAMRWSGLDFASVHRWLGILIYLGGLALLLVLSRRLLAGGAVGPNDRAGWAGLLLTGLGCYAGVTLLVPLLLGAGRNPAYWAHAAPVAGLVFVSGALILTARRRTRDDGPRDTGG